MTPSCRARASVFHMSVYDEKGDFTKCLEWLDQAEVEIEFLKKEVGEDAKA